MRPYSLARIPLLPLLATLLSLASLLACAPSDPKEIVVGAVLPTTGDAGSFGQNVFRGASLAIEEANASLGDSGLRLQLKLEDSRGEASLAVAAVRRLLDIEHAAVILGDVTSAGTHAILPIATSRQVPVISPAASDPALSGASPYFLRLWPSDVYEAQVIGEHALKTNCNRIAVIYANTDYGVAMMKQFRSVVPASRIAFETAVAREAADYRPFLSRVTATSADSIFLVLYPEDATKLLFQFQERSLSIPLLATATVEDPKVAAAATKASLTFASPLQPTDDQTTRAHFVAAYKQKYGEAPGLLADIGYDAIQLLVLAELTNPKADQRGLMARLKAQQAYPGASGTLTFTPEGDVKKPYGLKVAREGGFAWLTQ